MRRLGLLALLLTPLTTTSCKFELTPESLSKVIGGIQDARKELTPENEYYVGRSVGTSILARADYHYRDAEAYREGQLQGLTAYVNAVGTVVAMASLDVHHDGDREAPIAGWHFVVLEDPTINAFAAPGGFIFVTTGAIAQARNEDELAAVLAHEVAHVRRGHALGTIQKSRWANVTREAVNSTVTIDSNLPALSESFNGAMADMTDSLFVKGYSRDTEFEADAVGLQILIRAGYAPSAFTSFLKTLAGHQDTGGGGFSATHPKAADRIAKLEALVAKAPAVKIPAVRVKRFKKHTAADDES